MSLTEMESQRLSAVAIATRRFSSARHGYETDEVHAFLEAVAEHVRELESEIRRQHARMALLERRAAAATDAAYARVLRQLMGVVRAADQAGQEIRTSAEAEARAIIEAARGQAPNTDEDRGGESPDAESVADPEADDGLDVELLWGPAEP
ncbi:MAG TPA: DivIVA domain-containing protein [Actinomycetota bacterium]|nr:DivIVA domain-containing protein [Actinomycetota bacterium]